VEAHQVGRVPHYLHWVDIILIGWVVVSALITPLVGRFLSGMFPDPAEDDTVPDQPVSLEVPHNRVDA
jgi:hypothetical protein